MSLSARRINRLVVAWVAAGVLLIAGSAPAQDSVKVADVTAFRGSSGVGVPISLVKVEADEIFAVEIFLTYDATLIFEGLRYEDAQQNPALLSSWYVDTAGDLEGLENYLDKNFVAAGSVDTLKIAGATVSNPLPSGGVLLYVDFTVPDERDPRVIPIELAYVVLNADTPAVVPIDGSITLTGTDGTITSTPASLAHELEVQVVVTDVDEDRDPGTVDSIPVRVTVGAQEESIVAVEGEISSGTFNGSIIAVFSAAVSSGDGVVQVQDGDQILFCYDDSLDASGGQTEVCAMTQVSLVDIDGVITSDPASLVSSLDVLVTITDAGIPDTENSVPVRVTIGDQQENLSAARQAADRFELSISSVFSAAVSSGDGVVQVQNGDQITFCYDDLDASGGQTERCATTLVALIGMNGAITSDPPSFASVRDILVTVTDDDAGIPVGATSVPVRVTVGTQVENLSALEGAPGTFELLIQPDFTNPAASGDGVVQVQSGDQIVSCYDDLLDANGGFTERCATTEVLPGTLGGIEATVVVQPADTLRIRVEDTNLNTDPAVRDTVSVTVTSRDDETGAEKDEERVLLQETDVDTDLFFGEMVTTDGQGIAGDQILRIDLADTLFISYFDAAAGDLGQVDLRDTCVVVDPWGDASKNQKLGGQDAFLILSHSVGDITLVGLDSLVANVDLLSPGSPIEAVDASLVLRRRVGLIDHFPVQEATSANHPQPGGGGVPKPAAVERAIALEARSGYLAVVAEERDEIVAGQLILRGFSGRVAMADELADFLVVSHQSEEGTRIAFAGVEGVSGAGELLLLSPMDADRVELESARFNGGRIVGRLLSPSSAGLPPAFELQPNVPNPFNPETLIRYALPRTSQVHLEIFNAAGQRVRTLVRGSGRAGNHRVLWDGRDDGGAKVSAGVYFYRLKTGYSQSVRKMVLVK